MVEHQLDLFAAAGMAPKRMSSDQSRPEFEPAPVELDDDALVAAIPQAGLATAPALAAEAGRRRLVAAVPVLEELCRRFAGFGLERAIPEQIAALEAFALIGGSETTHTVGRLIARDVFQGPTRKLAVGVAARLRCALPVETVLAFLWDADPKVRADACRCAVPQPAVLRMLLDLVHDEDGDVRVAAACALGRMGRREARSALVRLLRDAPSAEVIDAIPAVADEDCVILLGRIVRTQPALTDAAREALQMIDHPRARQVIAALADEEDRRMTR